MKTLEYYKSLDYDIIVRKETMDGNTWFSAYCKEFGIEACHGIGDTREEAINSFLEEKDAFIEFLYSRNEPIPECLPSDNTLSGTFSVRTSPWLHTLIAEQAKKNDVSINSYINQILAFCVGQDVMYDRFSNFTSEMTYKMSEKFDSFANVIYNKNNMDYNYPISYNNRNFKTIRVA